MTDLPPFPGFRPEALAFLRDLREHNDREWFKPRKPTFDDELMWPARCLVADVSGEMARAGVPLSADAARGVFRIYRDTRFSKNKAPYKTHVGVVWSHAAQAGGGPLHVHGALYAHVEPGGCFLGAGFWAPEPALVRRFRERIAADPARLLAAIAEVEAVEGVSVEGRDPLKRMPRGYEAFAESDVADALRWKGMVATVPVADADVMRPDFARRVADFGQAALPLLAWGWDAGADAPA